MTLEEAAAKKLDLEQNIETLMYEFSSETELAISNIIVRKHDVTAIGSKKNGLLYTIDVDVRL